MPKPSDCPFRPGDQVLYTPSQRGHAQGLHSTYSALVPGGQYEVVRVRDKSYVVLSGFEDAVEGGLYWSEFSPAAV
jgi:hypothetical protein